MKIISLGSCCEVSYCIRSFVSQETYPFDWIWSNIDFVIESFLTGKFEFMACENLYVSWKPPHYYTYIYNRPYTSIENTSTALSLHDARFTSPDVFLNDSSAIDNINEKYTRRWSRLLGNLNDPNEHCVLVRFILPKEQKAILSSQESVSKLNMLYSLFTNNSNYVAKITFIVIDNENTILADDANGLDKGIVLLKCLDSLISKLHELRHLEEAAKS